MSQILHVVTFDIICNSKFPSIVYIVLCIHPNRLTFGESIAQQQNNPMHLQHPNEGKTQVNWGGCVIFNNS